MKKSTRKVLNVISIILAVVAILLIITSFFFDNSKILITALVCNAVAQFILQAVMRCTKKIEEN